MRVVIAGRGWAAIRTAKLISLISECDQPATIECIPIRDDDRTQQWLPSLRAVATQHGWRIYSSVTHAQLTSDDVLISVQFDRIIRKFELNGARAYNVHFSLLPQYRGMYTSYWPVRNGETKVGVTLHELSESVDAGPIIDQHIFPLPEFWSAYDLYTAFHGHAFMLIKQNVRGLLTNSCVAQAQDERQASYYNRRSVDFEAVEQMTFDASATSVRDRCRALIFPPAQYPTFEGRRVRDCYAMHDGLKADGPPGTVVARLPHEALVRCQPGLICFEFLDESCSDLPLY